MYKISIQFNGIYEDCIRKHIYLGISHIELSKMITDQRTFTNLLRVTILYVFIILIP